MAVARCASIWVLLWTAAAWADEAIPSLTIQNAVAQALADNPDLAVARQQRDAATAGVVLARIYPFNPIASVQPRPASGPGVTNPVTVDATLTLEVEVHGQRAIRKEAALNTLSRTEWEIAAQELTVAGKAAKAFNAVVYRQEKLALLQNSLDVLKRALADHQKKDEKLPTGELVLMQFEIQEAQAQLVAGRVPLVAAQQDLRQVMASAALPPVIGTLAATARDFDAAELIARAQRVRPDLQARRLAVAEGGAALRLQQASRHGNVTIGPSYSINETGVHFYGITATLPVPVCNRKQGELLLRQADVGKAAVTLRQSEIQTEQEINSALARLQEAQRLLRLYRDDYLPALQTRTAALAKIFEEDEKGGVDAQQVLELRRRLLKVRENYIDAQFDLGNIRIDLALAVGDLCLAFDPPPE